ncbi:penicillin-binding protein 1A [Thiobacter aerophilum]|uniref:Penicillin-binding protein 1A n=1 Tax=Thiobacter aerophilum TaxID=3121275 RepID=A0ABV0ED75_9BURK
MSSRWWLLPVKLVAIAVLLAGLAVILAAVLVYPSLPDLTVLTDYRPKVPLRVYTADGALLGEFGEERRTVVKIAAVPKTMIQAILAAEDERFYEHGGVDYLGVARAALANLLKRGVREGASTITMQVARNFFLTPEKTLSRKFNEALMAFKIERNLSKDKILELYINQIYLGQRAYGFSAAAQTYFGKPLEKLTVAEMAMLAGLPKAPSRYNPVTNPARAAQRQHYVLRRMRELGYIDEATYQTALAQKLSIRHEPTVYEVKADYVAEMARQMMFERYQEAAYTNGLSVITTLRRADQEAANAAVRQGLLDYDRRHGYRGPEGHLELPDKLSNPDEQLEDLLQDVEESNGLLPAVVLAAHPKAVRVFIKGQGMAELTGDALAFVQKALSEKAAKPIVRGSLVRVAQDAKGHWQILQLPQAEAALVSLTPQDGAIHALVGGFDYFRTKFNHVVQAWRQPGSSFKPFIYSAALEKGFTPATLINDAPIALDPAVTGGKLWEPKNFDGTYGGPTRMREALVKSKNLVSIRILQAIGTRYAQDYITRFGFNPEQHPPYLTMALGAGSVTPFQMATAYAVFANGGYRVKPYYVQRVVDARGTVLAQASPVRAGENAEQVIDPRNAFIMTSMMQDVVRRGTAARAMQLKRNDLAGKTGTTNDQVDAWFCGFNRSLVAVAWIGFDQPRSLGAAETGAQAALPIWMAYMGKALKGVPEEQWTPPAGVVSVHIDPATGRRVREGGIPEWFYQENLPPEASSWGEDGTSDLVKDQIF